MIAGAMALPSMSASDWVAKMTETFFLRSVFSHSRSWPAKPRSSRSEPALVDDEQRGAPIEPVLDTMEEIGKHRRRRARADQPFCLEGLDFGLAEALRLRVEQASPGTANGVGLQGLLQRIRLQENRQAGDRPFGDRGRGERGQCRP